MRPRRQPRRRRALAAIACLLWLLGVEVLPNLHLATHDDSAPHEHTPGGMIVTVSFGATAHRHADGRVHAHAEPDGDSADAHGTDDSDAGGLATELAYAPRDATRGGVNSGATPRKRGREGPLSIDSPPDLHVAAGLAHRALALHEPPPPDLEPVAPTRLVTLAIAFVEELPGFAEPATASARGPPMG